ncbi:hypothetical protein FKM82_022194 [Ascaphus truei]
MDNGYYTHVCFILCQTAWVGEGCWLTYRKAESSRALPRSPFSPNKPLELRVKLYRQALLDVISHTHYESACAAAVCVPPLTCRCVYSLH